MKKVIALLMMVVFLVSCAPAETEEIKIGVLAPLTGPVAVFGEYMRDGLDMAVEDVNAAGGVNGKQIKLIYEDTKCIDLKGTVSALKKLYELDEVPAVLGPYCGSTNTVAEQFATDNELFILSPGDNFGKGSEYKLNTKYLLPVESELVAEYALSQNWKMGVLYYDNDWGMSYRNTIKDYFDAEGSDFVGSEAYTFENLDVRTQLLKLSEAGATVIFITDGTGGSLFDQIDELGLEVHKMSEWEIEKPEFKGIAMPSLEGVVFFRPKPEDTGFEEKFVAKYDKYVTVAHRDSYDAVMILVDAMEACPDYGAPCMADYVTSLEDYEGVGGTITFNKEIWAFEKEFEGRTVVDGKFTSLE